MLFSMNKKVLFLALLSLTITFSACNKDEEEESNPAFSIPRIKSMTTVDKDGLISMNSFEYDNLGRLTKQTQYDGEYKSYDTYSYEPNKITFFWNSDNGLKLPDYYLLNAKGLVTEHLWGSAVYSEAGYLVQYLAKIDSMLTTNTITDGNTVKSIQFRKATDKKTTTTYTFNTKINTIGNENKGMAWMGKQDVNLCIKEHISIHDQQQISEETYNYSYEIDKHNRVIKKTGISENHEFFTTYTYY